METSSKTGHQVDTLFEDIARTVLQNKKKSLTDRIASVGFRGRRNTGEPGKGGLQAGSAEHRRAGSLPAGLARRINTLRRRKTGTSSVRLSDKSDPATKSRWKCSIL